MSGRLLDRGSNGRRRSMPHTLPPGIADVRELPDDELLSYWNAILVEDDIKRRLLSHAVFNFAVRGRVDRGRLPLHGVLLLVGPPGTGKTSLAKGLAARTAETLGGEGTAFRFVEVDPHGLSKSSLGKSQQAVSELFASTIAEQAALGPTVVLLDEVETIVADRAQLSLQANPIDVHRATDAALVQLDRLAASHPNLLFVATSNFPQAIDGAFLSRADLVMTIPVPGEEGRLAILRDTLEAVAEAFPRARSLAKSADLTEVARATEGLDGRALRKLVAAGCALDPATALDPGKLSIEQLTRAAKHAVAELRDVKVAR